MRIIGGEFKSRIISFPRSKSVRPAMDRIRETIFDILGNKLDNQRVLDLFAGSGSMGIEALSRGAEFVTFVDTDRSCIRIILKNLDQFSLRPKSRVLKMPCKQAIAYLARKKEKYHVIFVDPPYNKGLAKKTLLIIDQSGILQPHGKLIVEHARQETLPAVLETLRFERIKQYGTTCLSFYQERLS